MSRFRSRGARAVFAAAIVALVAIAGAAAPASAHPLGNFTVNRAIRVEIGAGVTITSILDLAEIPAFEVIRGLDTDGDERLSPAEGDPYAATTCANWGSDLAVSIDGSASSLEPLTEPDLTLPTGVGGLSTLRLVCRFAVETGDLGRGRSPRAVGDGSDGRRPNGLARGVGRAGDGATIVESDVPATSPSALLTAYPESALTAPPDVRSAALTFTLADRPPWDRSCPQREAPPAGPATWTPRRADRRRSVAGRRCAGRAPQPRAWRRPRGLARRRQDPRRGLCARLGRLRAVCAADRPLGGRSHTAGVLVLGAVTLVASELLLPERLIAWLSLGSGIVVTGLGIVRLGRLALARRRVLSDHSSHDHHHGHDHGHDHGQSTRHLPEP